MTESGSPPLKIGQTRASFHVAGKMRRRDWLIKEHKGYDNSCAISCRIRLFLSSDQTALPRGRDFKTDSTSSGVITRVDRNLFT